MSRKGNCWNNTPMELFLGYMRDEIDMKGCESLNKLKKEIDKYMKYYKTTDFNGG